MFRKIIALCCISLFIKSCKGETKNNEMTSQVSTDTLKRPSNISKKAFILDIGFDGELGKKIYQWAWYIGDLKENGETFAHIHGFVFCNQEGYDCDTVFYENIDERMGKRKFDFDNFSLVANGNMIEVSNKKEKMSLFPVVSTSTTSYKGESYVKSPSVKIDSDQQSETYNQLGYSDDISISIDGGKDNYYNVKFLEDNDGYIFKYKSNSIKKEARLKISFFNKTDGNIYFLDKDSFLTLVDKKDIVKIQAIN